MRKIIYVFLSLGIVASCQSEAESQEVSEKKEGVSVNENKSDMSLHDFKVTDINGEEFDLSTLKGKKVLIVNTASECGLTPQYEQLQELYETYGGEDFTIIGFPANNFGGQEPGSDSEIKGFCQKNYGVTFPMMSKISVKGDDIHPLYDWLLSEERVQSGNSDFEVAWNFHKFLIDENGNFVKQVAPTTLPIDDEITEWIQE